MLVEQIPPDKESIAGNTIDANQGIVSLVRKVAERGQVGAPVLVGHMLLATHKCGIIGHGDRALGTERVVVFHDEDSRPPLAQRLENVIVNAVDIHGKNAQFLVKATFVQQCRHVFARDERRLA